LHVWHALVPHNRMTSYQVWPRLRASGVVLHSLQAALSCVRGDEKNYGEANVAGAFSVGKNGSLGLFTFSAQAPATAPCA